jgi:DNA-binding NtrC family response regulator
MNRRVLIVEDDLDTSEMMRIVLESRGFDVHVVQERQSAMVSLQRRWPDVILLNIRSDGPPIEHLIGFIRSFRPEVRVVLMGGGSSIRIVADALGIRYFVQKPFDANEFVSVVEDAYKSGLSLSVVVT